MASSTSWEFAFPPGKPSAYSWDITRAKCNSHIFSKWTSAVVLDFDLKLETFVAIWETTPPSRALIEYLSGLRENRFKAVLAIWSGTLNIVFRSCCGRTFDEARRRSTNPDKRQEAILLIASLVDLLFANTLVSTCEQMDAKGPIYEWLVGFLEKFGVTRRE